MSGLEFILIAIAVGCFLYMLYLIMSTPELTSGQITVTPPVTTPSVPTSPTITSPVTTPPKTQLPLTSETKPIAIPVNGYYTDWSEWGACSRECGGGVQGRYRAYIPARDGGVDEVDRTKTVEMRNCNEVGCPVDGSMSEWSSWSNCDKSCGGGTQTRTRTYTPAKNGGRDLSEAERIKLLETQSCNTTPCAVNGYHTAWGEWTACDKTCGGGNQMRARSYIPAKHGGVDLSEAERIKLIENKSCNTQNCPINGYMSDWSSWSACSKTCGGGTQTRTRTYTPAQYGGSDISLDERNRISETQSCNTNPCPVNGYMSAWGPWSACTTSCGFTGKQTRTRTYIPPVNGGAELSLAERSITSETASCNQFSCYSPKGDTGLCFDGESLITLYNNSKKKVKNIEIGDRVKTIDGEAFVSFIVKTDIQNVQLCEVNGMLITPYHPVIYEGEWKFPIDITTPVDNNCNTIYSLAVSSGHVVFINDTPVVTFGHNFSNKVVRHEYFGSNRIIEDLQKINVNGVVTNPVIVRDRETNLVVKMK